MSVNTIDDLISTLEQKFISFDMAKYILVLNYSIDLANSNNILTTEQKNTILITGITQFINNSKINISNKNLFLRSLPNLIKTKIK